MSNLIYWTKIAVLLFYTLKYCYIFSGDERKIYSNSYFPLSSLSLFYLTAVFNVILTLLYVQIKKKNLRKVTQNERPHNSLRQKQEAKFKGVILCPQV